MPQNAKSSLQRGFDAQNPVDLSFIQRCKAGVVPVRQRPAAGNDLAGGVITNRLEFPRASNQLEVADMHASTALHTADAWALRFKLEWVGHAHSI